MQLDLWKYQPWIFLKPESAKDHPKVSGLETRITYDVITVGNLTIPERIATSYTVNHPMAGQTNLVDKICLQ